jgi:2-polyprenyl-3-methyl-5-hydroxy-6-metoxy-1,4-benzoquinol methylase
MNYINKIRKEDLQEFIEILKELNFEFEETKFKDIVNNTLKYINGDESKRNELRIIQDLENKWYNSLDNGQPDYSVYDEIYYIADTWVCWKKYSRQYLKNIISDKSMATKSSTGFYNLKSIKDELQVNSVIDLGCGIGYTTASLKEIFNCRVIGTNIKESKQYKVCEKIKDKAGFELIEDFSNIGQIDLVFASEYFEHFEKPVEHLLDVINNLKPKYIIFANTFNAKSIGHFNEYKHLDNSYTGKEISRLFTKGLKDNNYKKVHTNCFNNRPNLYKYNG